MSATHPAAAGPVLSIPAPQVAADLQHGNVSVSYNDCPVVWTAGSNESSAPGCSGPHHATNASTDQPWQGFHLCDQEAVGPVCLDLPEKPLG